MSVHARPTAVIMVFDLERCGEAIRHLALGGYNVVIPFYGRSMVANRFVSEIAEHGGTAIALFADIKNEAHVAAVLRTTKLAFGRCDLIIGPDDDLGHQFASAHGIRNIAGSRHQTPAGHGQISTHGEQVSLGA